MNKVMHACVCLLAGALFISSASAQPTERAYRGAAPLSTTTAAVSLGYESHPAKSANTAISILNTKKLPSAPVPFKAGDGTTLYGELTYSTNMDDGNNPDALAWGLYSFPARENTAATKLTLHNTLCANGGGAYRKGKLHFVSYYEDMGGNLGYLYFCTMDLGNYEIDRKALRANSYASIATDMTYDPVGDKLYAVTFDEDDYDLLTYQLVTISIEDGYATPIAGIARMSAIACDNTGRLFGVRYSDGKLVEIDKATAAVTEIGATGINPIYNGSATFDFLTGKLYWTTWNRTTSQTGLYEINPTTGAAELISLFGNNEQFGALYIPRADDITTLSPITNLKAEFSGASTDGTISLTVPSTDKSGNALDGKLTLAGYMDGNLLFSVQADPGENFTRNVTVAQGSHTFEAVASNSAGGRSDRASLSFYVGYDGPCAPANFTLSKTADNKARLTWETPAEGAHGGVINPALVYYRIVRMPDARVRLRARL